jgi:hypothetical protein
MGITYLHAVLLAKKAEKGVVTVRLKRNQRSRTMIQASTFELGRITSRTGNGCY